MFALQPFSLTLAFVWGAVWGSFLNVCIYRLPRGLSLVRPASHCPHCRTPLKPWHNIPILSYLVLRGRCAACKAIISKRYPLVELLTALLSVALWMRLEPAGPGLEWFLSALPPFMFHFVFVSALVVVAFVDFEFLLIPDVITLPGVLLGLLAAVVAYPETGVSLVDSLIGAAVGGGVLYGLLTGYLWLTGRAGLGGGDFKLMAMVGAFLGWQALPFVFFASALQGLLYALMLWAGGRGHVHREQLRRLDAAPCDAPPADLAPAAVAERAGLRHLPVPFGPFIALAAVQWLMFGADWLRGWLGLSN